MFWFSIVLRVIFMWARLGKENLKSDLWGLYFSRFHVYKYDRFWGNVKVKVISFFDK